MSADRTSIVVVLAPDYRTLHAILNLLGGRYETRVCMGMGEELVKELFGRDAKDAAAAAADANRSEEVRPL